MRRRRARRAFWAAFSAAAAVFGLIYAGTLGALLRAAAVQPSLPPLPDPEAAITLLIARDENPQTVCLLRFDPARGRTVCALLPVSLVLEGEPLSQLWRERGAPAAAAALATMLEIPIDRTLSLPDETIASLLNRIGSIDFTLETPVGSAPAGRQIFDGSRLALLARESAARMPADERHALLERAGEAILAQRLPLARGREIEALYLTAVNAGKNDLTALDYETRREALFGLLGNACGALAAVRVEGGALTETSREAIQHAFSAAPNAGKS